MERDDATRQIAPRQVPPDGLRAALGYADRGWAVFPCHGTGASGCTCGAVDCGSPGKHPRTPHGLHDASSRPEVICRWWERWPDANVGVRTGRPSGLVVVDVDPDHGGASSLEELAAAHRGLPTTLTVTTGGGGSHLYFAHPGGTIRNSAGALGPGLDIRSDGGYVIAPPSLHASGDHYRWEHARAVADLPPWLLDLVRPPERRPPPPDPRRIRDDPSVDAWARAALEGELARVDAAPVGQRNHTLNRAAFAIGQIVGAGHLPADLAIASLVQAGQAKGLPERESRNTVASGLRAGQLHPRHPAERSARRAHRLERAGPEVPSVELP